MSRSLRAAFPWRLSGNVLCIDTYTHTHVHTHAHHVGLHKQTPAGYAACSWLPFVCCCPAACRRCCHNAVTFSRFAPQTSPPPPHVACSCHNSQSVSHCCCSCSCYSCSCSCSFFYSCFYSHVHLIPLPFLFPLLLLLVLFLFHFLVLLPLALFTFYRLRAVVAWWLLFPTLGVATGSGQSSPPPSPCFYLNSLPFAVQLVQFGRVIQIPQAVGGSRHTLCILTPTHCHSHSHSTSHSPSLTISSEAQHLHSSGLVFGFRFSVFLFVAEAVELLYECPLPSTTSLRRPRD